MSGTAGGAASRPDEQAVSAPAVPRASHTRERIVTAATECVRRWGLRRVSMGDVAREAGVSRRSVYLHFTDRDALLLTVLERTAQAQVAAVAPHVAACATLAEQVGEAAVRTHALSPEEVALGLSYRPGESEDATLRLLRSERVMDAWLGFWTPYVLAARERGEVRADVDPRQASEWIMRTIVALVVLPAYTFDPDDPVQVRRFVTEHVVHGLAR